MQRDRAAWLMRSENSLLDAVAENVLDRLEVRFFLIITSSGFWDFNLQQINAEQNMLDFCNIYTHTHKSLHSACFSSTTIVAEKF